MGISNRNFASFLGLFMVRTSSIFSFEISSGPRTSPATTIRLVVVNAVKRPLLLIIGFIPALIFAWAFEMTPEGIKREREVDRTQSITSQTGRKLDRMIIGIMAVIIAFLVLDRFVLTDESAQQAAEAGPPAVIAEEETAPAAETSPSVAVLPFVNMSGNADNEYFSDGLTETLLHMLAQVPELRAAVLDYMTATTRAANPCAPSFTGFALISTTSRTSCHRQWHSGRQYFR